jgi:hypothetical protein
MPAADTDLLIQDQNQHIKDGLDIADNAIDLFHVVGGAPRLVSAAGGAYTLQIDATYTTDPNFVWRAGGYSKVAFDTNACPLAVIDGGEHVISGGTVTVLVVLSGTVTIESGATVGTLILAGGQVTALSAIATVHQSGGRLDAEARIGATSYTLSGGDGYIENTSGSACTILNLEAAGRYHPKAGDVATLNRRGGVINYNAALRAVTLGSTAFVNYAGASPASTGMVSIASGGTLTDYVKWGGLQSAGPGGGV